MSGTSFAHYENRYGASLPVCFGPMIMNGVLAVLFDVSRVYLQSFGLAQLFVISHVHYSSLVGFLRALYNSL